MVPSDYLSLIGAALDEDLLTIGDITSQAIFTGVHGVRSSKMALISKDEGVLAGAEVFEAVFRRIDQATKVEFVIRDGDYLRPGTLVAQVSGRTLSILTAERTAINFLALLSGIATESRRYADAAADAAVILDTRKTIPAFRALSKYAVRTGGSRNHRMGLYDMVLIKDNHIDEAGSIEAAVGRVRAAYGDRYRIEVECRTIDEVKEALLSNVAVVMLDNMSEADMRECVSLREGDVSFEASGNIGLERIPSVSATGVDMISVGALTHSVRSFDYSLRSHDE